MNPPPAIVDIAPWIALALFGFTFFWCFVAFLMSRLSGWARLASAYPAAEVLTPNVRHAWQSALMNANTKYNASLVVVADPQAVHFSTLAIFRAGHSPFSVPWPALRAETRQLLFVQRVALTFAKVPDVTMLIAPRLAQRLAAASGGRFSVPQT
jgi:hypothetical protein